MDENLDLLHRAINNYMTTSSEEAAFGYHAEGVLLALTVMAEALARLARAAEGDVRAREELRDCVRAVQQIL